MKKECCDCGTTKPLSEFYTNKQDGRPNQASHRPECKKCSKERREIRAATKSTYKPRKK